MQESYEKSIKGLGDFKTVGSFCSRKRWGLCADWRFVVDLTTGAGLLEDLQPLGAAERPAEYYGLPPFQDGHQAHVGGLG